MLHCVGIKFVQATNCFDFLTPRQKTRRTLTPSQAVACPHLTWLVSCVLLYRVQYTHLSEVGDLFQRYLLLFLNGVLKGPLYIVCQLFEHFRALRAIEKYILSTALHNTCTMHMIDHMTCMHMINHMTCMPCDRSHGMHAHDRSHDMHMIDHMACMHMIDHMACIHMINQSHDLHAHDQSHDMHMIDHMAYMHMIDHMTCIHMIDHM